jgi:hypothetical protein
MRIYLLLAIIFFLICLNSVLATDITTCYNITSSGYYQLTGNITTGGECTYSWSCITINASDVTLDLKGYSLINGGSCSYGVVVLPKNSSDLSTAHSNINIVNGRIVNFLDAGIEFYGSTDSSSITFIDFLGVSVGVMDGVVLTTNYDTNLMIGSNYFNIGKDAVFGGCLNNCKIYDNEIRYFSVGLYLYANGFDVQRNSLGYIVENATECFKDDYPIEYGIYCGNCNNTIIKNNDIIAQHSLYVDNAYNNNITYNVFRPFYEYEPEIIFTSTTEDNTFCNNQIIRVIPTWVYVSGIQTCYYATQTTNAKSLVQDSGSNTISESCTSNCQVGWTCSGANKIYVNSSCGITQNNTCSRGCESGIYGSYCIGDEITPITTTTTTLPSQVTNVSWYTPIINQTDLNDASLQWITPFVSPFFIIIASTIIGCAVLTGLTKSPIVFPLSLLGFTLVFWYYQILPNYIAIMLLLLEFIGSATLFKNQLAK